MSTLWTKKHVLEKWWLHELRDTKFVVPACWLVPTLSSTRWSLHWLFGQQELQRAWNREGPAWARDDQPCRYQRLHGTLGEPLLHPIFRYCGPHNCKWMEGNDTMLLWHWSSWSWTKSKKGRIQREKVARLDSICMFGQELPTYRSLSWPVLKCTYADTSSVAVCPSDFPSQRVSFLEHGPLSGLGRKPGQWQRLP